VFYSLEALRRSQPAFSPVDVAVTPALPSWADWLLTSPGQQRLSMREWEDEAWRRARGEPAVSILEPVHVD
jgi:hypothetical protein